MSLLLAEMILRKTIGPWVDNPQIIKLEPAGQFYIKHNTLGYTNKPGEFKVTLASGCSFRTTHLSNGARITHPLNTYPAKTRKEIWIFGCSVTYGWSLDNEETYPWLLQKKITDYEVVNFGVNGYSTLQSLIKFREALENWNKPDLVILNYASFHDERNTGARVWIKGLRTNADSHFSTLKVPIMRFMKNNKPEIIYMPWESHLGSLAHHSALANYLDSIYNSLLDDTDYNSHEISKVIIKEFSDLCNIKGITLVIAGIGLNSDYQTTEMLDYFNKQGVLTADISLPSGIKENKNLPCDTHPSAIANKQFEQKIEMFLCGKKLIDGPPCSH